MIKAMTVVFLIFNLFLVALSTVRYLSGEYVPLYPVMLNGIAFGFLLALFFYYHE